MLPVLLKLTKQLDFDLELLFDRNLLNLIRYEDWIRNWALVLNLLPMLLEEMKLALKLSLLFVVKLLSQRRMELATPLPLVLMNLDPENKSHLDLPLLAFPLTPRLEMVRGVL